MVVKRNTYFPAAAVTPRLETAVQTRAEKAAREGKQTGPPHAAQGEAKTGEPLPERRRGPGTDLHSPAGVRPKFGHSLEHIVLQKKPPPPGKETGAGGVAAPLRGPAPPARAQAEGFWVERRRVTGARGAGAQQTPRGGRRPGRPFSPARCSARWKEERWRRRAQARRARAHSAHAPGRSPLAGRAEVAGNRWSLPRPPGYRVTEKLVFGANALSSLNSSDSEIKFIKSTPPPQLFVVFIQTSTLEPLISYLPPSLLLTFFSTHSLDSKVHNLMANLISIACKWH